VSRRTLERTSLTTFVVAVFALTYWRLYQGVDFTDESWYVAVAYRFALGGKPYVDELSVPQTTAAILLYPLMWTYHAIAGRAGIVLFVRHVHLVVAASVGLAVWASLRRLAGPSVAVFAGACAFTFVPFNIPSVSYDSLGSGLFTAGTLLGLLAFRRPAARPWAGLSLGLSAFAYPPLILAVGATCALRLWLTRTAWRSEAAALSAPALGIPLVAFAVLGLLAGPHRVISDYRRSSHFLGQAGGLTKLHGIAAHLKDTVPLWYLLAAGLLLVVWSWSRWPRVAAAAVALLPLTALPTSPTGYAASLNFVAHVGWLALPLYFGVRGRTGARELLVAVWLPAVIGGLITSYSSANGGINFGVGFFPAVIVSVVFSAWAIERLVGTRLPVAPAPAAIVAVMLVFFSTVGVYRDASLGSLDTQIGSGPYAGLVTNRAKQAFLTTLGRDLDGVGGGCTIAFTNDFPAGYLLSAARPATNAVWVASVPPRLTRAYHQDLVEYWATHGYPDVLVLMRRIPFALPGSARRESYAPTDPFLVAIRTRGYRATARRTDYTVYRRSRC
jgi:hypothetical protein